MLYELKSVSLPKYGIIEIENFSEKYYDYFIKNIDNSVDYSIITFKTKKNYTQNDIIKEDFLYCSIPVPIFSENFVECLKNDLLDEIDFINCKVECCGKIFRYYIGKIKKVKNLLIKESLKQGISIVKYDKEINEDDFIIARDTTREYIYLANNRFKKLINEKNINIKLKEI